jgi:DNA-binding MarR family transcriptional regulator
MAARAKTGIKAGRGPGTESLDLESFLPYQLSVLSNRVSQAIAQQYHQRFGLSIAEWRVMTILGRYAPLSANEVCERTSMNKVRVSRALSSMVAAGLVSRRTDKGDRRRAILNLSAKGKKVYGQIVPLAMAMEASLLESLGPREQAQLVRLLAKLSARTDQVSAQFQVPGFTLPE